MQGLQYRANFNRGRAVVRVLILGGTGRSARPSCAELVNRGHEVWALARSDASATKLRECGATAVAGDIAAPERWTARLPTSMRSFTRPAISAPRWVRSMPACSTRCCPPSPRSRKSRASSIPAVAGCSAHRRGGRDGGDAVSAATCFRLDGPATAARSCLA